MSILRSVFVWAAALALSLPVAAMADPLPYTSGHADFGAGFEEGGLHLHLHAHAGTVIDGKPLTEDDEDEFELDDIVVVVPESAKKIRLAESKWSFLGVDAGEELYVLSQGEVPGEPFLGLGAHGGSIGTPFLFELIGYTPPVSGAEFSMYSVDGFGDIDTSVVTSDGVDSNVDQYTLFSPAHAHTNWAFTEPGDYFLEFMVSAPLGDGGEMISDTGTLHFHVVPEPSMLALLGLAVLPLGYAAWRRRK